MSLEDRGGGRLKTQRHRGEAHVKTEVEIRLMLPEAKEYVKLSEAGRGQDGFLKGVRA